MADRARRSYATRQDVRQTVPDSPDSGGLADDYYKGHPAAPRGRRKSLIWSRDRDDDGDNANDDTDDANRTDRGRSKSRMRRAMEALEIGGVGGALRALRSDSLSRSRSVVSRQSIPLRRRATSVETVKRFDGDSDGVGDGYALERRYTRSDSRDQRISRRVPSQPRAWSRSPSPSRSRPRFRHRRAASQDVPHRPLIEQATSAALVTAAVEAWRLRHNRGSWVGGKGGRVMTAAISAGAIEAGLASRNPDRHNGRHVLVSTLGGLLVNHIANGSDHRRR